MDIQKYKKHLTERLTPLYERKEAEALALKALSAVTEKSYPQLYVSDYKLTQKEEKLIEEIISRLESHEPLQYILGSVVFGDLTLAVSPGVLIPRPETEEMCALMLDRQLLTPAKNSIDIGTGSGAIALYMAYHGVQVDAVDFSTDALEIARVNVEKNKLSDRVSLHQLDILSDDFSAPSPQYDLIVSNPPYVLDSERIGMSKHVLEHEPESALFVTDSDPLLFYRAILEKLTSSLRDGGWVVFELNALTAQSCVELCESFGLDTELVKDMEGKDRFTFAQKPL